MITIPPISPAESREKGSLQLTAETLVEKYREEQFVIDDFTDESSPKILPQALVYDNSVHKKALKDIVVRVDMEYPDYAIPGAIRSEAQQLLAIQKNRNPELTDAAMARLNDIVEEEGKLALLLSRASYFDYLATNYSMDLKPAAWPKTLREKLHGARLPSLKESLLANHIGIGVLLFTRDGYLILQRRADEKLSIRPSQLAPSVSGAAEFKDLKEGNAAPVYNLFLREGKEELNLDMEDYEASSIQLLGITRELLRGGKPEIFFSATLRIDSSEIRIKSRSAKDRWENEATAFFEFESFSAIKAGLRGEGLPKTMKKDIQQLREAYENISLPLLTGLTLWYEYYSA
ncbi:MAG: hypothetical protein H6566_00170 [Lewinellaceae bacterium]|nr:hypothetical protein [Lewinellaceae bacterium]